MSETISGDTHMTGSSRQTLEKALAALDLRWSVFSDFSIGTPPDEVTVDFVVIHPERGVALVDLPQDASPRAVERFRELLDSERFDEIFPGTLPVVRVVVRPEDAARIEATLDRAFATAKRVGIAD